MKNHDEHIFEYQRIPLLCKDRMEESSSDQIQVPLVKFEPGWQGARLARKFAMQVNLFSTGKLDSCVPELLDLSVGTLGEVRFRKPLLVP